MVGTLRGARDALCGNLTEIGEGSYRVVYRQGDVVYKVEYDEGIEAHANSYEWEKVHNLPDLPPNVAVPDYSLYDIDGIPVLAADYIEGRKMGECYENWHVPCDNHEACLPTNIENQLSQFDLAYGNVIFDGDTYWIVDVD